MFKQAMGKKSDMCGTPKKVHRPEWILIVSNRSCLVFVMILPYREIVLSKKSTEKFHVALSKRLPGMCFIGMID